jgi:putative DNA primase/helicase
MIPFNVQFGEGKDLPKDDNLPDLLRTEAAGILAWLVQGCLSWQEEGLETPEEVLAAIAEYRAEMDVLAEFIEDCCLVAPGLTVTAKDIYSEYCNWAEEAGLKDKEKMKQRTFGICLGERGFKRDKGAGGRRFWHGVGLRST